MKTRWMAAGIPLPEPGIDLCTRDGPLLRGTLPESEAGPEEPGSELGQSWLLCYGEREVMLPRARLGENRRP